ncbi:hypothetical protein FRB99_005780 [Tulasnella sp. 403]|nr:hypothetical protein FRB99_005780 [Tulasnella sp. 403]
MRFVLSVLAATALALGVTNALRNEHLVYPNSPDIHYLGLTYHLNILPVTSPIGANFTFGTACDRSLWTSMGLYQSFEFEFVGTGVTLFGTKDSFGGFITFTLDGEGQGQIQRFRAAATIDNPICTVELFKREGLTLGPHKLTVNHTADNNGGSDGENASFSYQYITYERPTATSGPGGGAIVGAALGGVALFVLIGVAICFRNRKHWRTTPDGAPLEIEDGTKVAEQVVAGVSPAKRQRAESDASRSSERASLDKATINDIPLAALASGRPQVVVLETGVGGR